MNKVITCLLILPAAASMLVACGNPGAPGSSGSTQSPPVVDKFKDFGDYTVHFNAITTDLLSPEIAKQYNIPRSKSRAMLNVAIHRDLESGGGKPVTGDIVVKVSNLTGQLKTLQLRQINEGEAIYYIGDLAVANREVLIFDLQVTPSGETDSFNVRYQQQFVTE